MYINSVDNRKGIDLWGFFLSMTFEIKKTVELVVDAGPKDLSSILSASRLSFGCHFHVSNQR